MKNSIYNFIFIFFITVFSACGGGDSGKNTSGILPNPSGNDNGDLSSLVINTLEAKLTLTDESGNPFHDFGQTAQNDPLHSAIKLTNNESNGSGLIVTISLFGSSGGFRMMETDDNNQNQEFFSYKDGLTVISGSPITHLLTFDASLMGVQSGYIEVTVAGRNGYLRFPFRAQVTGASEFRVVAASYMCSDKNAPQLSKLDFLRVASTKTKKLSFKVCNQGGSALKVNDITFDVNTKNVKSEAMSLDVIGTDLLENDVIDSVFNSEIANPTSTQNYSTGDNTQAYTGPAPDGPSAFSVTAYTSAGTSVDPKGLVIASGSYLRMDVTFSPDIQEEAPNDKLFDPIAYSADMNIDTSLGEVHADVVGATGGLEPMLEISYVRGTGDSAITTTVDITSYVASIDFGSAGIFEDWVAEKSNDVTLTIKNVGSGSKSLKVWGDNIVGYFAFAHQSPELTFPITLASGKSKKISMKYHPTPASGTAQSTYDIGQMQLYHNAPYGPKNWITLIGQQTASKAVVITQQGGVTLKKNDAGINGTNPYDPTTTTGRRKNFCLYKADGSSYWNKLIFDVTNNSGIEGNNLTTTWSVSLDPQNGRASGSVSPSSGQVVTAKGETKTGADAISFIITPGVDSRRELLTTLTGVLRITNTYDLEGTYGALNADYDVYFSANISNTGECSGGSGQPLTGTKVMVFDAMTMNMPGGAITEPATNRNMFKTQMAFDFDSTNKSVRIHGLKYDPIPGASPVKQFRSYAHQLTGASFLSWPGPTNPYRLEYQPGSVGYEKYACPYTSPSGDISTQDGTVACMESNGAEDYEVSPGVNYKVFYHEFIKFDDNCNVEYQGKVADFYLKAGEDVGDAAKRLESTVGTTGTEAQYDSARGAYQFDSYIEFNKTFTCGGTTYNAGDRLTGDPDALKACWGQFETNKVDRFHGFFDECNYFNFIIDEGCVPSDVPWRADVPSDQLCTDSSIKYSKPDTWKGFGEYEPDENDETKWHMTVRNIHLQAFVLHSNGFFTNRSKMLYSDIEVTLTTKAIGADGTNDLIAVNARDDFADKTRIHIPANDDSDSAHIYWINHGKNGRFTVGDDDNVECDPNKPLKSCRGVYQYYDKNHIVHAGEPINYDQDLARVILVGASGFHGHNEMAPFFAQEDANGRGASLYFSLHGCVIDADETEITEDQGCYPYQIDNKDEDGNVIEGLLHTYEQRGRIASEDLANAESSDPAVQALSKAYINTRILNFERDRASDYYNSSGNYFYENDWYDDVNDPYSGAYGH